MKTARLKLNSAYERDGFSPIITKRGKEEFKKFCLTKIYQFRKLLMLKGYRIQMEEKENTGITTVVLSYDNKIGYLFTIDGYDFTYEIYRRLR